MIQDVIVTVVIRDTCLSADSWRDVVAERLDLLAPTDTIVATTITRERKEDA